MPTVGAAKASEAPVPLHRDDQPSWRTMWRVTPHALRCTAGRVRSGTFGESTQAVTASSAGRLRFPESAYLSALTHDNTVPDTVECRLEWPVGGTGVAREWRRVVTEAAHITVSASDVPPRVCEVCRTRHVSSLQSRL
jgi:hypothetical protein